MINEGGKMERDEVWLALWGKRRGNEKGRIFALGILIVGATVFCPSRAPAQGETTSAVVGRVTDATDVYRALLVASTGADSWFAWRDCAERCYKIA
jgi:hypothetical protein